MSNRNLSHDGDINRRLLTRFTGIVPVSKYAAALHPVSPAITIEDSEETILCDEVRRADSDLALVLLAGPHTNDRMTTTGGEYLSDGARKALISTLDAYHGTDSSAALRGDEGAEETDSLLVLRRLLEGGQHDSEQELKIAIAEYTEGRPLAYITGTSP